MSTGVNAKRKSPEGSSQTIVGSEEPVDTSHSTLPLVVPTEETTKDPPTGLGEREGVTASHKAAKATEVATEEDPCTHPLWLLFKRAGYTKW